MQRDTPTEAPKFHISQFDPNDSPPKSPPSTSAPKRNDPKRSAVSPPEQSDSAQRRHTRRLGSNRPHSSPYPSTKSSSRIPEQETRYNPMQNLNDPHHDTPLPPLLEFSQFGADPTEPYINPTSREPIFPTFTADSHANVAQAGNDNEYALTSAYSLENGHNPHHYPHGYTAMTNFPIIYLPNGGDQLQSAAPHSARGPHYALQDGLPAASSRRSHYLSVPRSNRRRGASSSDPGPGLHRSEYHRAEALRGGALPASAPSVSSSSTHGFSMVPSPPGHTYELRNHHASSFFNSPASITMSDSSLSVEISPASNYQYLSPDSSPGYTSHGSQSSSGPSELPLSTYTSYTTPSSSSMAPSLNVNATWSSGYETPIAVYPQEDMNTQDPPMMMFEGHLINSNHYFSLQHGMLGNSNINGFQNSLPTPDFSPSLLMSGSEFEASNAQYMRNTDLHSDQS